MKKAFFVTLLALMGLALSAQDICAWGGLEFDSPSGFEVVSGGDKEFFGKASCLNIKMQHFGRVGVSEEVVKDKLHQICVRVASDWGYSQQGEVVVFEREGLNGLYLYAKGKSGDALFCVMVGGGLKRPILAVIAFSDGAEIVVEAVVESFRAVDKVL